MNLFDLPQPAPEEAVQTLAQKNGVQVQRIVSHGHTTGWQTGANEEFVALLAGSAELEYADGRRLRMAAGDTLVIPAGEKHRVAFTSSAPPCVWLCVFY